MPLLPCDCIAFFFFPPFWLLCFYCRDSGKRSAPGTGGGRRREEGGGGGAPLLGRGSRLPPFASSSSCHLLRAPCPKEEERAGLVGLCL